MLRKKITGLPKINEISKMYVHSLFPYIHDLCNFKLFILCFKSLIKPFIDYIQDRRLNLNLGSSYLRSFKSSIQSHPLWVTLYGRKKADKQNKQLNSAIGYTV